MTSDIISIAQKVRNDILNHPKVRKHFCDNLGGCCAIASARLHVELKKNNINSKICLNNNHCFLIVDTNIVDITATQFGSKYPEVLIVKFGDSGYNAWWSIEYVCHSIDDLLRIQRLNGWPKEQMIDYI